MYTGKEMILVEFKVQLNNRTFVHARVCLFVSVASVYFLLLVCMCAF